MNDSIIQVQLRDEHDLVRAKERFDEGRRQVTFQVELLSNLARIATALEALVAQRSPVELEHVDDVVSRAAAAVSSRAVSS